MTYVVSYVDYYSTCLILNGLIRNENMQLKVLELAFYRKCSTENLIFHQEKRRIRTEKFVFGGKIMHVPNYAQLILT